MGGVSPYRPSSPTLSDSQHTHSLLHWGIHVLPQLPNEYTHSLWANQHKYHPDCFNLLLSLSLFLEIKSLSLAQSLSFCERVSLWLSWCVCVWLQVPSTDDSSWPGHHGISGNSEPALREEEWRRRKTRKMLSSQGSKAISIHYQHCFTSTDRD